MTVPATSETRLSLLGRLQQHAPDDASAWQEFVRYYGPKIDAWCRHWGLQEADSQDLIQTVLVKLAVKMGRFCLPAGRQFPRLAQDAGPPRLERLCRGSSARGNSGRGRHGGPGNPAGADDLEARLAEAFDLEVLEVATARVKQRVAEATWEAFRLTALEGLSAADAAKGLGMPVANVFKAKSNVRKMLQDEIRQLEGGTAHDHLPQFR